MAPLPKKGNCFPCLRLKRHSHAVQSVFVFIDKIVLSYVCLIGSWCKYKD